MATDLITLTQAKAYIRMPAGDTTDDTLLQTMISGADEAIRGMCGDVVIKEYDEYYDGGDYAIYLRHCPVLTIDNVIEGWGFADFELANQPSDQIPATSIYAYSLDIPGTGKLSRRTAGNANVPFVSGVANIHVTYEGGRSDIPAILQLAAMECVRIWYQSAEQRGSEQNNEYSYDSSSQDFTRSLGVTSINYGIPISVINMCRPHRRSPFIG